MATIHDYPCDKEGKIVFATNPYKLAFSKQMTLGLILTWYIWKQLRALTATFRRVKSEDFCRVGHFKMPQFDLCWRLTHRVQCALR